MFQELQNSVAALIRLIPQLYAARGNVITRRESNVEGLVTEKITGKLGLSVIVLYPFPKKTQRNVRGLSCKEILVGIRVCETVMTNKSGVTALQAAEFIHRALHLFVPGTDGLGQNPLVALDDDPWRDPPTIPGRNEVDLYFLTGGEVAPINLIAPGGAPASNYRFQNSLTLQIFDETTENFTTIWASTVGGVVVPLLADSDDSAAFTGNPFAPLVGANARVNAGGVFQLLNPGTNGWHGLYIKNGGVTLDQTPDFDLVENTGNMPLLGANFRVNSTGTLAIVDDDGLFFPIFVKVVNGAKSLIKADDAL